MLTKRNNFTTSLLLIATMALGLTSCSQETKQTKTSNTSSTVSAEVTTTSAPKEINFGIISTESSQNLKSSWEPLLADMSKSIGMDVKAFFASDYAGIIQGMRFNKVDMGWFGNKSAMEAVDRANGEVFAQTVNADGSTGYYSLLIVHKDSPYNNEQDILNNASKLTFGNGDPNSTSGYLVPGYYVFAKNDVDPVKIFKRTLNANHESNALAVANKQVDVATFNTETWERLKARQPEKIEQLKIVWKSPKIAADPIVWRKDLDEETKKKIQDFFMNYGKTAEQKKILDKLGWSHFQTSTDAQLDPIRELESFKAKQNTAKAASKE